jgi:ATP synthase protein I
MVENCARIIRRSAAVAALAGVIMVALCAVLGGTKGLLGAMIGVAVVALFFGISVAVVSYAARISPQAMMGAALGTFFFKILALIIIFGQFQDTTAFNPKSFGLTVLVCVLAYSAGLMAWSMRLKALYVEPDGER